MCPLADCLCEVCRTFFVDNETDSLMLHHVFNFFSEGYDGRDTQGSRLEHASGHAVEVAEKNENVGLFKPLVNVLNVTKVFDILEIIIGNDFSNPRFDVLYDAK